MHLIDYRPALERIAYCKRLPGAVYVFRETSSVFGEPIDSILAALVKHFQIPSEFNLVKFRTDALKISFLHYPEFFDDPHPALRKAITIDLVKGKARETDYANNINPPILHRKESFLSPAHPLWEKFRTLSEAEEAVGLYGETTTIGFKLNWERLLQAKGVILRSHTLERRSAPIEQRHSSVRFIERHKTAMTRYELSKPVKTLLEYGVLKHGMTFFDYGCGQGSDVRGLQGLGYVADGWDPVFRAEAEKTEADVVNLGYVVNVIEDPAERLDALVDAYRHTKRLLVVSALISETVETNGAMPFRDGVLTKRSTFQKYFEQQELQQYIEDALETSAVPVALGIFYVFRDPAEQQDFLSARSRRAIDWSQISARLGLGGPPKSQWAKIYEQHRELLDEFGNVALKLGRFPQQEEFPRTAEIDEKLGSAKRALRAFVLGSAAGNLDWPQVAARFGIGQPPKAAWEVLYEQNKELFDGFWEEMLRRGRLPAAEEFSRLNELIEKIGSPQKALRLFLRRGGAETLKQAVENRQKDLLVYVALANLRKRVPFGHLSLGLRLDVKEFFGSYKTALEKGLELLYAAGDAGEIELACEDLALGWQDEQALYVHRSLVDQLPPVLRAYVGCATTLFGAVEQADLIKIHKKSGKVTFLVYDDFENKALPGLHHRIKVNLRTRWVEAFDHRSSGQLLYYKERFLHPAHPQRATCEKFSAKLRKLNIPESLLDGPTKDQFGRLLAVHGLNGKLNRIARPSKARQASTRP
jgi:hypothetical protein